MKIKKTFLVAAFVLLATASTAFCSDKVVEIRDKMFLTQTDEIYLNAGDYIGRTIRYEGIYTSFPTMPGQEAMHMVFRRAPGCCGNDGSAGFLVTWDGEYPNPNAWVQIEGVLESPAEGKLVVRASSLSVLEKRGQEFVTK